MRKLPISNPRRLARACAMAPLAPLMLGAWSAFAADPKPLAQNVLVEAAASADLLYPKVARDAAGDFVVVWVGPDAGTDGAGGIYARLYRSNGRPKGASFLVNNCSKCIQGIQENPDVAMNAAGDFVVVWQSQNLQQDGDSIGVYGRWFAAGGVGGTTVFRVNETTTSHQRDPAVAMDAQGNFAVAFESFTPLTTEADVFVRRYDANAVDLGPEKRVNSVTADDQNHPKIAIAPNGGFIVAWESDNQDRSGQSVYFRRFSAAGNAAHPEEVVGSGTGYQTRPAVAADLRGNFVVLWKEGNAQGRDAIWGRVLRPSGETTPEIVNVVTGAAGESINEAAVSGSLNGFVVSWPSDSFASGTKVLTRRLRPSASPGPVTSAFKPDHWLAISPDVASDADGDFVVVSGGHEPTAERDDILLSRFSDAEIDLTPALHLDRALSGPLRPGATLLVDGTVKNLEKPASLDAPPAVNDAIGLASGIRVKGKLSGSPASGVLSLAQGRNWQCKVEANNYDCRYDRSVAAGEFSAPIELEVEAPGKPSQLLISANVVAESVDPRADNDSRTLKLDIACTIQVSQNRFRVDEGVGTRKIAVERLGEKCPPASVDFDTVPGTADAGADYTRATGQLTWQADDQQPKSANLVVADDALDEANEVLDFVLSNPVGTKIEGPARVTVTIVDNDPPAR